ADAVHHHHAQQGQHGDRRPPLRRHDGATWRVEARVGQPPARGRDGLQLRARPRPTVDAAELQEGSAVVSGAVSGGGVRTPIAAFQSRPSTTCATPPTKAMLPSWTTYK